MTTKLAAFFLCDFPNSAATSMFLLLALSVSSITTLFTEFVMPFMAFALESGFFETFVPFEPIED